MSKRMSFSFQFAFRIRIFTMVQHAYFCDDLSIEITGLIVSRGSLEISPSFLPEAPSSAGFLDICEPPHVWMSRRNGAANPGRHGVRIAREPCRESESRVRECHRSTSTWCTRIYYEQTRMRTRTRHASGQRAYVIIIAAHVVSRIFCPRIPFSILAKVVIGQPSCVCPAQNPHVQIRSTLRPISYFEIYISKKETRIIGFSQKILHSRSTSKPFKNLYFTKEIFEILKFRNKTLKEN